MRIIAGAHRGKKLLTPIDDAIRPTSDKARAALFNILATQQWIAVAQPFPQGAHVLDLACGTGAWACEALSRGAITATLYDNDPAAVALARKNILLIGSESQTAIIVADLKQLPKATIPFDIIFCDPPYGKDLEATVLMQLQPQGYVHGQTIIIVETGANEALKLPQELHVLDNRRYGAARLWFLGVSR